MKQQKILFALITLSFISSAAYANITNQVFLSNHSLNKNSSYQITGAAGAGSLISPGAGITSQFTITTKGICEGDVHKSITYPIKVLAANGQTLCSFDLELTIANDTSKNFSSNKQTTVTEAQCYLEGTSESSVQGKIKDLISNSTNLDNDFCTVKWIGKNQMNSDGYYQSGEVFIVIASKR